MKRFDVKILQEIPYASELVHAQSYINAFLIFVLVAMPFRIELKHTGSRKINQRSLELKMFIFDNVHAKSSLYTRKVSHMYINKPPHAGPNNGNWKAFLVCRLKQKWQPGLEATVC